ncbi:MAG: PDZ domain-containing protein, partial [Bacteroidota bacterium]
LGVQIISLDGKLKAAKGLETDLNNGVYIDGVGEESAAKDAGLETGDIIVAVDGIETPRSSKLQEIVARKRPGDQVSITYYRKGQKRETKATLRSQEGTTAPLMARADDDVRELGANFTVPEQEVLDELDLKYGVQVRSLMPGKLRSAGVREGFIITKIDRKPMRSIKDIKKALDAVPEGGVLIEGYYPNGKKAYYAIGS